MPSSTRAVVLRLAAPLLLAGTLAGCGDRLPTESAALPDPSSGALAPAAASVGVARDLGVLPGETTSEATFVTDRGVVFGKSGGRFFRWTAEGGMQEVSSIPTMPAYPIPAGAPAGSTEANAHREVTGGSPPFRWSASEGRRPLAKNAFSSEYFEVGRRINRWGHVVSSVVDCCSDFDVRFWSPMDTIPIMGREQSRRFPPLGDDDVVYTQETLSDYVVGVRATSPHLVGRTLVLSPPAVIPPAAPACAVVPSGGGVLSVTVTSTANFRAVGYASRTCSSYRRAILYDLTSLERPRPAVRARDSLVARFGAPFELPYRFAAHGSTGPWTVRVEWGDQTAATAPGTPGSPQSLGHVYAVPGTYLARVYVRDALGAWNVDETVVDATRPNAAPRVRIAPLVAGDAVAGREFVVRARFSDDSPDDGPWTFAMDWGTSTHATGSDTIGTTRGRRFRADPIDLHFTYDTPGTYTFRFAVTDRYGATSTTAETTVRVVAR